MGTPVRGRNESMRGCTPAESLLSLEEDRTSVAHEIDPAVLALGSSVPSASSPQRPPRRVQGAFLRGPVPWHWLVAAGRLHGKAVHIGLFLWFKAGCTASMTVSLSLAAVARELGCDRSTASRALGGLVQAGLVTVTHAPGRKVGVTILAGGEPDREP